MNNSGNGPTNPKTVPTLVREGVHYFKTTFCKGCQSCMDVDPGNPDSLLRSEHVLLTEDITPQIETLLKQLIERK